MNRFKFNIRYIRGLKQLTQEELSDEMGVRRTTIVNWEQGLSYPKMELLFQVREYFGVSLDDLLLSNMEAEAELRSEKVKTVNEDQIPAFDNNIESLMNANLKLIENNSTIAKSAELNAATIDKLVKLLSDKKE